MVCSLRRLHKITTALPSAAELNANWKSKEVFPLQKKIEQWLKKLVSTRKHTRGRKLRGRRARKNGNGFAIIPKLPIGTREKSRHHFYYFPMFFCFVLFWIITIKMFVINKG